MSFKRALATAFIALAALPAAAAAQTPVTPPDNDNYLQPFFVNGGNSMTVGDVLAIQADTTNYTVQPDLFSPNGNGTPGGGGPPEPTVCEGYQNPATYGNTIWSVFRSRNYGRMNVSAASGNFDEVIRVVPFTSPDNPTPVLPGACYDNLAGSQESASGLVFPGQFYAVQVGGTIDQTSPTQGGPMQVKFELHAPPSVAGDALLFWRLQPLRVTSLTAQGVTKGAKVTLTCTKRACKRIKKTARKPFWAKPLSAVGPAPAGVSMKSAVAGDYGVAPRAFRPVAHAARTKFVLMKNRRVKKGATIKLRITAPGFIGKYFFWKVKKNSLTNKKVSCTDPGSSKPKKLGTCHG